MTDSGPYDGRLLDGRYELSSSGVEGGMGYVYLATDRVLGRYVAIKMLPAQHLENRAFAARFRDEARAVAALDHPNIVKLHDWHESSDVDGMPYFVMQYLQGGTLRDRMDQGAGTRQRFSLPAMLQVALPIAAALDFAHTRGVIHRDIKPSNIMFDANGNVYLVDFGIAKDVEREELLTKPYQVVGTRPYMSPEQVLNKPITPASDQYSLAIVIYEMLAGRSPFNVASSGGSSSWEAAHVMDAPLDLTIVQRNVPPAVWMVLQKALAKLPEERFRTVAEMGHWLERAVNDPLAFARDFLKAYPPGGAAAPTNDNRLLLGAVIGTLLIIAGVVGWLVWQVSQAPLTPTPTSVAQAATASDVPPTASDVPPSATTDADAAATVAQAATSTDVPATTAEAAAAVTDESVVVAQAATATDVPPTATSTDVPPTATDVPPTATPTTDPAVFVTATARQERISALQTATAAASTQTAAASTQAAAASATAQAAVARTATRNAQAAVAATRQVQAAQTATANVTPSATPTPAPTATATLTATPTLTATSTITLTSTLTPTATQDVTATAQAVARVTAEAARQATVDARAVLNAPRRAEARISVALAQADANPLRTRAGAAGAGRTLPTDRLLLLNPDFAQGADGWQTLGNVQPSLRADEGQDALMLAGAGGTLFQDVPARLDARNPLRLDLLVSNPTDRPQPLRVTVGAPGAAEDATLRCDLLLAPFAPPSLVTVAGVPGTPSDAVRVAITTARAADPAPDGPALQAVVLSLPPLGSVQALGCDTPPITNMPAVGWVRPADTPDADFVQRAEDNVLLFKQQYGGTRGSLIQTGGPPLAEGTALAVYTRLASTALTTKLLTLEVLAPSGDVAAACTFVLPSAMPQQTVGLRLRTPAAWDATTLRLVPTVPDGTVDLVLSSTIIAYDQPGPTNGVTCLPPTTPPNRIENPTLADNGAGWDLLGSDAPLFPAEGGAVFNGATGLRQTVLTPVAEGQAVEFTVLLGNTSDQAYPMGLWIFPPGEHAIGCVFRVPPTGVLAPYTMQILADARWTAFAVRIDTLGGMPSDATLTIDSAYAFVRPQGRTLPTNARVGPAERRSIDGDSTLLGHTCLDPQLSRNLLVSPALDPALAAWQASGPLSATHDPSTNAALLEVPAADPAQNENAPPAVFGQRAPSDAVPLRAYTLFTTFSNPGTVAAPVTLRMATSNQMDQCAFTVPPRTPATTYIMEITARDTLFDLQLLTIITPDAADTTRLLVHDTRLITDGGTRALDAPPVCRAPDPPVEDAD